MRCLLDRKAADLVMGSDGEPQSLEDSVVPPLCRRKFCSSGAPPPEPSPYIFPCSSGALSPEPFP